MRKKSWKLIGLVATAGIMLAGCLSPGYHLVTPTLRNGTATPGLWHTFGGNNCYWARLDGNGTVLASASSPSGPRYVQIESGDTWFRSVNCLSWAQADGPFDRRVGVTGGTFGNGDFRVGHDIGSGTYIASQPVGCYWARLSGFSGAPSDVIQSNVGSGEAEIAPTDVGFSSTGCGTWTLTSSQISQTITFAALANKPHTEPPFTVTATASSGLVVTFSTTTPGVCASGGTNGSLITVLSVGGQCTVRASQAGNAFYNAAPNVDQSFNVT
jgi:hypothetical protein